MPHTILRAVQWVMVFGFAAAAAAQVDYGVTLLQSPKLAASNGFGSSLLAADVNQDGFSDLIVGEGAADGQGILNVGRAWILYGPTFTQRKELAARPPVAQEFMASRRGAAGDVNADGAIDLVLVSPLVAIAGQPEVGRAHVFFGPSFDEAVILDDPTPQVLGLFGYQALVVDQGDGHGVVHIAAPRAWMVPRGSRSTWFVGEVVEWIGGLALPPSPIANPEPQQFSHFGAALFSAHWNADQAPDLFVGRSDQDSNGDVVVLDGVTRSVLAEVDAPPTTPAYNTEGFGSVFFLGDLDGDGAAEMVVGAPNTRVATIAGAGALFVLDGTGFTHVVHAILPPIPAADGHFGEEVQVADLDVDGHLDLVVNTIGSAFTSADSAAHVYFGPDFTRLQTVHVAANSFGHEAATGDFDGDGAPELAVSALWGDNSGRVYLYDRRSLSVDATGVSSSAGGTFQLQLDLGTPSAGLAYVAGLSASGTSPGVILGEGSYVPLNPDALTVAGLALLGSPMLEDFVGTLDSAGRASLKVNWPAGFGGGLVGSSLSIAAVAVGPDGRPKAGSSPVSLDVLP